MVNLRQLLKQNAPDFFNYIEAHRPKAEPVKASPQKQEVVQKKTEDQVIDDDLPF